MIFSTSKQELYWILSFLLKSFDIDIIKKIVNEKQKNELKDATEWHLLNGIKNNRLRYDKYLSVRYCRILFNPYFKIVYNERSVIQWFSHTSKLII